MLSKLYERHLYEALYSHLSNNNFLYGLQSGFRKRYSTETALIRLLDQILLDLDKNHVTGVVFVDYFTLLQKLSAYGVDDTYLKIFQNYLSDRTQFVEINGFKSCPLCITHCVPQGSILGNRQWESTSGIDNVRINFINGRPSSRVFAPSKEKVSSMEAGNRTHTLLICRYFYFLYWFLESRQKFY
jgi:hypothetical protein